VAVAVVLAEGSVAAASVGPAVEVSKAVDSAVAASIEVVDTPPVHGAVALLKVPAVVLLLKAPVAAVLWKARGELALPEGLMEVQPSEDRKGASMLKAPTVVRTKDTAVGA
jgi:hypothetical protein